MRPATPAIFLVLALCAGSARSADDGRICSQGGCGAGSLAPAAVREAIRGAARETPGAGAAVKRTVPAAPADADAWKRAFGAPGTREDFDCALSVGAGGTLRGGGFLGMRVLGRTQVWRGQ